MSLKKLLLATGLLASVAVALGFYWPFEFRKHETRFPGVVEVQEVRLGSKIGGRVAEVLVREGDLVLGGTVLVHMEAPELEAQRNQWRARLRNAEATLAKLRN